MSFLLFTVQKNQYDIYMKYTMTFKIFKNIRAKSNILSIEPPYIEDTALGIEH